jgi:hypothetical protein
MQIAVDLPWARQKTASVDIPNVQLPQVDLATKVEDTRRAVSDGADQISTAAQDLGREAANLGREAMKIGRDAAKAGRGAARKGQLLAATSGETLGKLRSDAAATVDDLRSIRIVRDRPRGPDLKPGVAILAGASAGVAAMFFLDPEQGRRRRVTFMDQLRKYSRLSGEWLEGTTRDLRNRSVGLAAEARRAADSMSKHSTDYDDEDVIDTPDISQELKATDWPEPATPEPVTPEPAHTSS